MRGGFSCMSVVNPAAKTSKISEYVALLRVSVYNKNHCLDKNSAEKPNIENTSRKPCGFVFSLNCLKN